MNQNITSSLMSDAETTRAVEDALQKRAFGYDCEETIEESVIDDGKVISTNITTRKKHIPGDSEAFRLWLLNKIHNS